MKIIIGNDHAGVEIKEAIISFLKEREIDWSLIKEGQNERHKTF